MVLVQVLARDIIWCEETSSYLLQDKGQRIPDFLWLSHALSVLCVSLKHRGFDMVVAYI